MANLVAKSYVGSFGVILGHFRVKGGHSMDKWKKGAVIKKVFFLG